MEEIAGVNPEVQSAVIAATVAVVVAVVSVFVQVVLWFLDKRAQRKHELLAKRRESLFLALQVVDHVYANTSFGSVPCHPYSWQVTLAREAMNGMIVFCKNPKKTVGAFSRAIGLHNPESDKPGVYGPDDLTEFRRTVCEEIELPGTNYDSGNIVWISTLHGAQ